MALEILSMLKDIKDIMIGVKEEKRKNDATYDDALRAITMAVFTTRTYLRDLEDLGEHNREIEKNLVEHWNEASVKLRSISPSLAVDCSIKAFYWSDTEKNTPKVVRKLDDIFADCLELVSPKKEKLFSQNEINILELN